MATQLELFGDTITTSAVVMRNEQSKQATLRLRPLYDRVLVRQTEAQDVIKNGLYVPDTARERPLEGEVIAVGTGRVVNGERIPVDVKVGSIVVFGKYSGNEVEILGEKLLLLSENEIMGQYFYE